MTVTSSQTGQRGEQIAQAILRQKGFLIEATNWRSPRSVQKLGEIDIVARHPQENLWVFVEVKTRKNTLYGTSREAIDQRKQEQLATLAEIYLSLHPPLLQNTSIRFDVICIDYPGLNRPAHIQHIENAF